MDKPSFYQTHSKFNNNGKPMIYGCCNCLTHLTTTNLVISDRYTGSSGNALLIYKVLNVKVGRSMFRKMTTGDYTVADICCHQCGKVVGWKYLKSSAEDQKFKEGRFILECAYITVVG
ncbi:unnamed protein product [Ambrosiozyma monospora]|uniref:Protein yippee-like n=1 Tax=Ambrosiozyma monospora TaxID=43982 RepID=A0A9W7DH62_AMBMO|nr:unnamed protein product [Ambrosiozyma monospora]